MTSPVAWPFLNARTKVIIIGATSGYGRAQISGVKSGGAAVAGIVSPGRGGAVAQREMTSKEAYALFEARGCHVIRDLDELVPLLKKLCA